MRVQSGSIVSSTGQQGKTTISGNYSFILDGAVVRVSVTSSQPNQHGVVNSKYKISIMEPQKSFEFTAILNALQSYVMDDSNLGMRSNSNLGLHSNSLLRRNSI